MKKGYLAAVIVLAVIVAGVVWYVARGSKTLSSGQTGTTASLNKNGPPLLIKHMPIAFGPYDATTNKAGDFVFTKKEIPFDRLYMDYGFFIPASPDRPAKNNPQPTFIVPLGTKVHAITDGIVIDMPTLYSQDYSIMVASDARSPYRYETEHVIKPTVKVGDSVKAGQVIAEVSDYDKNLASLGFGLVELGLLKGGNPPQHLCPFAYLDPSIQEKTFADLTAFYKDWNNFTGKRLYNETEYAGTIGCLTMDAIDG